jgi:hypothetical protein
MGKSNKVAVAVSKSVNPSFARDILAQVEAVATKAVDVQISTSNETESFRADFRALCLAAGVPVVKRDGVTEVFDRESEVGKALDEALRAKATESAKTRAHYSVEVHRVGDDDKYLPVRIWSPLQSKWVPVEGAPAVNHTFTAAFALGVDLKTLPSVAEKPNGVKAWMRGTMAGCRPDGKGQGMRDWIKNDVDQALSRGWKTEVNRRSNNGGNDLADMLKALDNKTNRNKRTKYERDNGAGSVVSQDQWSMLCSIMFEAAFDPMLADEIIAAADRAGS